jgi:hypothetical protein
MIQVAERGRRGLADVLTVERVGRAGALDERRPGRTACVLEVEEGPVSGMSQNLLN